MALVVLLLCLLVVRRLVRCFLVCRFLSEINRVDSRELFFDRLVLTWRSVDYAIQLIELLLLLKIEEKVQVGSRLLVLYFFSHVYSLSLRQYVPILCWII